jgi:adenylyl cyclase-associated protein
MAESKLEALITRLEAAVVKLEGCESSAGGDGETEDYPQVLAYDSRFGPKIESFLAAAKGIDSELAEMSQFIADSFREVRRLILAGARHSKPDNMTTILAPLAQVKEAGIKWCEIHYRTKWINHEKAVHEALTIFDWITYGPSAGNFVGEMIGAVQCYTNKIAMEFREKDKTQMQWVQGLVGALKDLPEYISDFHKNGLAWNARASKATGPATMKGSAAAPAAAAAPTPAPAPAAAPAPAKPAAAKPALALKVPVAASKVPSVKKSREGLYTVEFFDGGEPELPKDLQLSDIVNFYQCKNCMLRIPVKVKGVSILNCERVTLVLNDVVGVVEVTSCKRLIMYTEGRVPSMTIDKCDNVQINLNEKSLDCQITAAQSQGLNVDIPDLKEEGNMIEFPVPEQIRVYVKDRKLVHEVYVHE